MEKDLFYSSTDGLELYARQYGATNASIDVLCMHGLTRNHKDFEPMIAKLGEGYRYISVDVRGRGKSAYSPNPENYEPAQYADDMITLLNHLELKKVVLIGTSMGGLISMFMMDKIPDRILGVVLNDIGPIPDERGIRRISTYASSVQVYDNWKSAAISISQTQKSVFPDYNEDDWIDFAKRTCSERSDGTIAPDYDTKIMTKFSPEPVSAEAQKAMWDLFNKLNACPLLIVRGGTSDILTAETASEMKAKHQNCQLVTVQDRGHAPMLDEPEAVGAISAFLDKMVSRKAQL